jgi:competence protein ComEC
MTSTQLSSLKKYPFIRLLLPLIAGIILQWYFQIELLYILLVSIAAISLLFIFIFLPVAKKFSLRWLQGYFIMIVFTALGSCITYTKNITHQKEWMGSYYQSNDAVIVTLEEPLVEKNNSYKAIASVNAIKEKNIWKNSTGKILVYLQKDSSLSKLGYGSQLLINKPLQTITNSGNPGAFDYKRYCLFQDVTHQVFLKQNEFIVLQTKNIHWLQQKLFDIRNATIETIQKNITGEKEQGVAEALLIGYRNDLDKDLVQAYSNTGVVHIIAISGLHIGMIYALMIFIFSFLKRFKWTNWFKPIIILFVLWAFTLVAGAVPSILRSAVMFSFIIIGQAINRKTNIYNTLAASAFCMLVYNPFMLWDVGFLLSYAAVISIITFMQPVYRWLYFENKILDKIWALTSVTISAQVLTLPIVIFYFHQFPNFFLITNMLVVPLSGIILYGEILLLCVAFIIGLASIVGKKLYWLIHFMNTFIEHINNFPFSVWNNLQINIFQTWMLYGFIILICVWLLRRSSASLIISLSFLSAFIFSVSVEMINCNQQQKLIVYNVPKQSAMDVIQGDKYYFVGDSALLKDGFLQNFHLKPARNLFHAASATDTEIKIFPENIVRIGNVSVLLIDNAFKDFSSSNKTLIDIIVICKNPTLSINQLQNEFACKEIVFDSSNPLWKIERWKKECDSLHLRFHSVPQQGAFVMDL